MTTYIQYVHSTVPYKRKQINYVLLDCYGNVGVYVPTNTKKVPKHFQINFKAINYVLKYLQG